MKAHAIRVEMGKTSKGDEQVVVHFQTDDENPRVLVWFGYFTEKTTDRTLESLVHCGFAGDDIGVLASGDARQHLPQAVDLVTEWETYEGKDRERVRWVNEIGGARTILKNAMDADEARVFGAQMRNRLAAVRATSGASRAPAPRAPAKERDDIPF